MQRRLAQSLLLALTALLAAASPAAAQGTPVGFLEEFALAEDRGRVLEQLVPGTEDHDYFTCLWLQQQGDLDGVDRILDEWKDERGRTSNYRQIEARQALLRVSTDPDRTYRFLESELGLRFDERRRVPGESPDLPTVLDPNTIDTERLLRAALSRNRRRDLTKFETSMLENLVRRDLSDKQVAQLLDRLPRADVPGIVPLVLRDMAENEGKDFGYRKIHGQLMLDQLEALRASRPELLGDANYVNSVLRRLAPTSEESMRDAADELAYLERVSAFTDTLPSAFRSLKAHLRFHRLSYDLDHAAPDRDRVLQYLRMPRNIWYCPQRSDRNKVFVDPNQAYGGVTPYSAIGQEEPIVAESLRELFRRGVPMEAFRGAVEEDWLKRVWAETKLMYTDVADPEPLIDMIGGAGAIERLRERVEVQFLRTNPTTFGENEPVQLDVEVKNVDSLLVEVFPIDAIAYFDRYGTDVRSTIDLDGLVANESEIIPYEAPPLRRVRRTLALDRLTAPGTYVVNLIGGDVSSRAVVRKGTLQLLERVGAAGHVFHVVDEDKTLRTDAILRFGGRDFLPDENGAILVPFTTSPGQKTVLLRSGETSSIARFDHQGENYRLEAAVHAPREALLAGMSAEFVVRPRLALNDRRVDIGLLEDAVIEVRATQLDGSSTTMLVDDLDLSDEADPTVEIQVPENARSFSVALRGRVERLTDGERTMLEADAHEFTVNQIQPIATRQALLTRTPEGYAIDVVGRNGEAWPEAELHVRLKHHSFTDVIGRRLMTDERGRARLGSLANIDRLEVALAGESHFAYDLRRKDVRGTARMIHANLGEAVQIPYVGPSPRMARSVASLIARNGSIAIGDHFENLSLEARYLVARDLPVGDYDLVIEDTHEYYRIRVTEGVSRAGHLVGDHRIIEESRRQPLHIVAVGAIDEDLVVQLGGSSDASRVHVFTSRTIDPLDARDDLAIDALNGLDASSRSVMLTTYESGRKIGDEYRYILDRREVDPLPGNMLRRPGYLLNPWAVAQTSDEMASEGEEATSLLGIGGGAGGKRGSRFGGRARMDGVPGDSSPHMLDFLGTGAAVVHGVRPDDEGTVRIPMKDLGDGHVIRIVAVDDRYTVTSEITRAERPWQLRERRLVDPLDPATPTTQQRRIVFLDRGESFTIRDAPNAGAQTFGSLSDVFGLYRTIGGNAELDQFEYLMRWPSLSDEEKLERYSETPCHEVHAFLREHDPAFFQAVVRPYLENKGHRTFMDDWLLGADLASYLEPHRFERLNIVEAVLLLKETGGDAERYVQQLLATMPRGTFSLQPVFGTILASGTLDGDVDSLGAVMEFARAETRDYKAKNIIDKETSVRGRMRKGPSTPGPASPPAGAGSADDFALGRTGGVEGVPVLSDAPFESSKDSLRSLGYAGESAFEQRKQLEQDVDRRRGVRAYFYRDLDDTQEYAESHYWKVRLASTHAGLVTASPFWHDFAKSRDAFVSTSFPFATRNVNEMLLALAFLDLPFEAEESDIQADGRSVRMNAGSPTFLALQDIAPAEVADTQSILVGQNWFRNDQRTELVDGVQVERYVTGEFLVGVPYGARMVVTNPTPRPMDVQALVQIPEGAIALSGTKVTDGMPIHLPAYGTHALEALFYFPAAGKFDAFPVHVGSDAMLLARAEPQTLDVVVEPTVEDTDRWEWISQNAELPVVLEKLRTSNPRQLDLDLVAWRMADAAAFREITKVLAERHVLHDRLWKYGVKHRDAGRTREFLETNHGFVGRIGMAFTSPLMTVAPRERAMYEHLAYEPLVNGRTHEFGGERRILNAQFAAQYSRFLRLLAEKSERTPDESMELAYYLLLQDRVREALDVFDAIDPTTVTASLQHDYMTAYMSFFRGDLDVARTMAERHRAHPVAHWRSRFGEVIAQLDEIEGRDPERELDPEDRDTSQGALAGSEPVLTLQIEDGEVRLTHARIENVEVRYHRMDVEFLFSASPFVRGGEGSFGLVQPNRIDVVELDPTATNTAFALPAELQSANVVVEVRGAGLARRTTYFAGTLDVQSMERYGEVRVIANGTQPLSKAYVKVYAQLPGGGVRFHKDGYTDLRGRFDYVSLSGVEGPAPERYAVLVMHDEAGATMTELAPPAR